jgi:hypothetical protein
MVNGSPAILLCQGNYKKQPFMFAALMASTLGAVCGKHRLEKIMIKSIATFIHKPVDESTGGTILFVAACLMFVQVLTVLKHFWIG